MVTINSTLISNFLNTASNCSKDNGINTIVTTTTNLVRGGVVLVPAASPNMKQEDRTGKATYFLAYTIGSIATQLGIYKLLDSKKNSFLGKIGIKRLGYKKYADNLKVLQNYEIEKVKYKKG